jgi:RelA/SpoT family (p)ppGpp synthetase
MSYLPPAVPFVVHPIITPELAYTELITIAQTYLNVQDLKKIDAAYIVALHSHSGQLRKSGESYITHPLQVASFAAQMRLDVDALVAAVLHDCVEDSHLTVEEVALQFGNAVALLVDGLTKIEHLKLASREEQQAENFRKMLLAMSQDLRVMLIKLCDRNHNMRTLASLDVSRRKRIAQETLDIFAPVAHRLGLNPLYRELQELAFAYLKPMRYKVLVKALNNPRRERLSQIEQTQKKLYEGLKSVGIEAQLQGRNKALYSIYRKMERKHLPFAKVNDIFGLRVIVDTEMQCYLALGATHKLFKPQPGRIKDFIALPKPNGYQSLHTTLLNEYGIPFEVQIRSVSMHRVAENGIAAHWLYKNQTNMPENALSWVRELLELDAGGGAREFLEHVKADLFPDHVYVFTPKGKIIALPKGSTALDFAYAIHSDIGNTCFAVDVNDVRVSLRTVLRTGDKAKVHTCTTSEPKADWLQFIKTAKARAEVRHYIRGLTDSAIINLGQTLLTAALSNLNITENTLTDQHWGLALHTLHIHHETTFVESSIKIGKSELFIEIGLGKRPPLLVAQTFYKIVNAANNTNKNNINKNIIGSAHSKRLSIAGTQGIGLYYSLCCLPIPGDAVIGKLNHDGSLNVHLDECNSISKLRDKDPNLWLDLNWGDTKGETFCTRILVDVRNGKGVLAQVAAAITDAGCNISQVRTEDEPGNIATMLFQIAVYDRIHLAQAYRNLRRVPHTLRVRRESY